MGKWTHVGAPTKGYLTSVPSTMAPPEHSPSMKGVILVDGSIKSDFGHTDFPVAGDTTSNHLDSSVMKIEQFYTLAGLTFLLAFTTRNVYLYNTTTTTWDCLTPGNVIDDCEAEWDQGTGVVSHNDEVIYLRDTYSARHIILASVPAFYFAMEDDAANTGVADSGGSDLHGTASANTDTLSALAIVADGFDLEFATGHYVNIDTAIATVLTDTAGSVTFYINQETPLAANRTLFCFGDTNGAGRIHAWVTADGAIRAACHTGTAMAWDVQTADDVIESGTDFSICVVHNGTTPKIYLDSEDEGLIYNTSTDLTCWMAGVTGIDNGRIGCTNYGSAGNASFFDGIMDEWRYYSSAITARETIALWNYGDGTDEIGGFTTGVISSEEDVTTSDISGAGNTHISFWVRTDKVLAAGVVSVRLSEQNAGGIGATYADYDIPAMVADEWVHITKAITPPDAYNGGGTFPDDLDVLSSIALVANTDPGAITIWLDDVRTGLCTTGDEDNRFSTGTMNDTFIVTNGVDQPKKITETGGVLTVADLVTTLAAGSITTSELAFIFKDHVVLLNNTENAADAPQRASWTNIGKLEDFIGGTAGYQDLVDDESWIIGIGMLGENSVAIYKERSIVLMTWVGGHTPFRFKTMIKGEGLVAKDAFSDIGGEHLVMGEKGLYSYRGETTMTPIDNAMKTTLYDALDGTYRNRSFFLSVEEDDEVQVWIPTATVYPDEVWCYNTVKQVWYRKDRTMTGFGGYDAQSSLTIGDLTGTIGEQNWRFGDTLIKANSPMTLVGDSDGKVYKLDKTTLNNDGTAITNTWETVDFVLPDTPDYMNKFMRVTQLLIEASGQSVDTSYSTDGGATWNASTSHTLISNWDIFQHDFDTVARKIRFRFRNTTASSGFNIRYFGFYYILRSGRR